MSLEVDSRSRKKRLDGHWRQVHPLANFLMRTDFELQANGISLSDRQAIDCRMDQLAAFVAFYTTGRNTCRGFINVNSLSEAEFRVPRLRPL